MSKYLDSNGLLCVWSKIKLLLSGKVDVVAGKQLSTNDYTNEEKIKLAGLSNYTHPTTSGNKHVPAGGASGQILRWSADGTAAWGTDNNTTYSVATTSANGLMSAADKTKLDGFGAASAYALKTDIAGVYKYKGSKATVAALPSTGSITGDVWNVEADGMNYAWTGSAWDALGMMLTIDAITNSEIDTIVAS